MGKRRSPRAAQQGTTQVTSVNRESSPRADQQGNHRGFVDGKRWSCTTAGPTLSDCGYLGEGEQKTTVLIIAWSQKKPKKNPTTKPNPSPACWYIQKKKILVTILKVLPQKNQLYLRETSFRSQMDQREKEFGFLNVYRELLKSKPRGLR